MPARGYFALAAMAVAPTFGCAHVFDSNAEGVGMIEGDNTHRYAVFRHAGAEGADKKAALMICMESVGPAAMTHRFDALFAMNLKNEQNLDGAGSGKGKGADGSSGDANARFSYRNFQDLALRSGITYQDQLAQLFTVDDIMQFAHESLYRLCEARANGVLDDDKYNRLFASTLDSAKHLIEQQMQNQLALDSARLSASIQLLAEVRRSEAVEGQASKSTVDFHGKPVAPDLSDEARRQERADSARAIDALMGELLQEHAATGRALRGEDAPPPKKDLKTAPGRVDGGDTPPPGAGPAEPHSGAPGDVHPTPPKGLPPPPKAPSKVAPSKVAPSNTSPP